MKIKYLPFLLLVPMFFLAVHSLAKPVAQASQGGITITLHDDPCKSEAVSNLPYRITWTEKGKTFEGCFTVNQGIVVAYFTDDKTVAIMPGQVFSPVSSF